MVATQEQSDQSGITFVVGLSFDQQGLYRTSGFDFQEL